MSLGLVLLCVVGGCSSETPAPDAEAEAPAPVAPAEHSRAEAPPALAKLADVDRLRDAFNADADKGRMILLLEPG